MKTLKKLQIDPEKRMCDDELSKLRGGNDLNCYCRGDIDDQHQCLAEGYMLLSFDCCECQSNCAAIYCGGICYF